MTSILRNSGTGEHASICSSNDCFGHTLSNPMRTASLCTYIELFRTKMRRSVFHSQICLCRTSGALHGRRPSISNTSRPLSVHVDDYNKVAGMKAGQNEKIPQPLLGVQNQFTHHPNPGTFTTCTLPAPPANRLPQAPPTNSIGEQLLLTLEQVAGHIPGVNVKMLVSDPNALKIFLSQHPDIHARLCKQLEQTKSRN